MIPVVQYTAGETPDRLAKILARADTAWDAGVLSSVAELLRDVKTRGDDAVSEHTARLDGVELSPEQFRIPREAMARALDELPNALNAALRTAIDNVRRFHDNQRRPPWFVEDGDGVILGKVHRPVDAAGIWVPGGAAPLISTLYMCAVPAKVAGVGRVVVCTAPQKNGSAHPAMLAAAELCGVDEMYQMGGVLAVGAMAFGTDSVAPVDVVVGPGNQYVQAAKQAVVGTVGIDMIAGPSEVIVIADNTANPAWVAADMLSQAEHGSGLEAAVAIVTDTKLGQRIAEEVDRQSAALPYPESVAVSLENYGTVFVAEDMDAACEIANRIAAEHVELHVENPWELAQAIRHAGAIFLGGAAPEPVGDYYAGTNHVLPTGRAARFSSSLGVDNFMKSSSIVAYTGTRLAREGVNVIAIAEAEGLEAHARAVKVRLGERT